jgi:hypothetical protein
MADELFCWQPGTRRTGDVWPEVTVIESSIHAYQAHVSPSYAVTTRPDLIARNLPEIDAVAEAPGLVPLAIEHTRIESFRGQLLDDSVVNRLLGSFQQELARELPEGLACSIPVLAFKAGFDWYGARKLIADHLRELAFTLKPGASTHHVPGVPFPVRISYQPELRVPFRFWRVSPEKDQISTELLASTEKALLHKKDRLREYRALGYRTVLLLESNDSSLVSWTEPYRAFLAAERTIGTEHVVDVLFGWTEDPYRIYWFGFKGDEAFLDGLNMPNFRLGPKNVNYWATAPD